MKKFNLIIKKIIFVPFVFICLFIFTGTFNSQNINFTSKIDSIVENGHNKYLITVVLTDDVSAFTVSLFGRDQNLNYKLIEKKDQYSSKTCTFYTYERRKWMVVVESGGHSNSGIVK